MFEFLHSELDMLKCDEDFHSEHDYCRLIETEKPTTGNHRNIEIKKYEIPGQDIVIPEFHKIYFKKITQNHFVSFKSHSDIIYIKNNSLLI